MTINRTIAAAAAVLAVPAILATTATAAAAGPAEDISDAAREITRDVVAWNDAHGVSVTARPSLSAELTLTEQRPGHFVLRYPAPDLDGSDVTIFDSGALVTAVAAAGAAALSALN